jgi:HEAT repeat protein
VDTAAEESDRNFVERVVAWLKAGELEPLREVLLDPRVDRSMRMWLLHQIDGSGPFPDRMSARDRRRFVPMLIQLLSDDDCGVRGRAAEALGHSVGHGLPVQEATEALLRCVEDDDKYVRWKALLALSYIGEQKAVPAFLEIAERPEYPNQQRRTAVGALGRLGAPEAETYFIDYLGNGLFDADWAAGWLEEIGTEASLEPLHAAAKRYRANSGDFRKAAEAIEARRGHAPL